jgi:(1->4)-alpha-D-glucan 1-alpha-D-glucosylmutase
MINSRSGSTSRRLGERRSVPGATYRLQFHKGFTFQQAGEIVEYLHALGISHCYASPIAAARAGSTHGYDACSFEIVNPELGGRNEFEKLARKLQEHNMSLVLDIVPNHMATDGANPWWQDVLKHGSQSPYARWFDIEWDAPDPALKGKVLLPILGDTVEKEIAAGKIHLKHEKHFSIEYYDKSFPLSPASVQMLQRQVGELGEAKLLHKYNDRKHPVHLHHLLEKQYYRLAYWRVALDKLNYRRFFDVSHLIGLRVELPEVFEAIHRLPLSLVKEGKVSGLRVDHPDGFKDPTGYFQRLKVAAGRDLPRAAKIYIVAEKILTGDERLRGDWPVDGTTGYDFLNKLNGLFVDASAERQFDDICREFTGCTADFSEIVHAGKRKILSTSLKTQLNQLARKLKPLLEGYECSFEEVVDALREVIVHFAVYRTYISEHTTHPTAVEAGYINRAVAETLAARPDIPGELLRIVRSILLLKHPRSRFPRFREFVMRFQQGTAPSMAKGLEDTAFYNYNRLISLNEVGGDPGTFGISIDAFHAHNQFIAAHWPNTLLATETHDSKRGEDERARINVLSEFPDEWREAVRRWAELNAGKKVKVGGEWGPSANDEYLFYQALIGVWPPEQKYSVFSVQQSGDPLEKVKERMVEYMAKAVKEEKARTSWLEPNQEYEAAVQKFVSETLDESVSAEFLQDFQAFQKRIAFFGYLNSLSQLVLKLTSPGVPDLYQGCELWDFSLVDPDNRRPVDYKLRKRMFERLSAESDQGSETMLKLLQKPESGAVKMYALWRALSFRQSRTDLFARGDYIPIEVEGAKARHVVAFARSWKKESVIAVAPRLIAGLCGGEAVLPLGLDVWKGTALLLPKRVGRHSMRNVITGEFVEWKKSLPLAEILSQSPVAILQVEAT